MGGIGFFNGAISFVSIVAAPIVIKILFGAQYLDCVTIFRILMTSYFFQATFRIPISNILFSQRKLKSNTISSIVGIMLTAALSFIFVPYLKGIGTALSYFITYLVIVSILLLHLIIVINNLRSHDINESKSF